MACVAYTNTAQGQHVFNFVGGPSFVNGIFCCDELVQIDSPAPVFALSELLPSTTHTVISAHMMHETSKRHAIQKNHAIGQDAEIDACFWCCNMHCFCCWCLVARKKMCKH